jgi:amino acid transporter
VSTRSLFSRGEPKLCRNTNRFQQVIALYNGGPPGVIYAFIAVSCMYFMIAACIAEMASAIPSSSGVYHWASVTAGAKYGKIVGYFAGWYVFPTVTIIVLLTRAYVQREC